MADPFFMDGFDDRAATLISTRYDAEVHSGTTAPTAFTIETGRFSGSALGFKPGGTGGTVAQYLQKSLGSNLRTASIEFGLRPATKHANHTSYILVQTLEGANVQIELVLLAGGALQVRRNGTVLATSASLLSLDAWNQRIGFQWSIGNVTGNSATWGAYLVKVGSTTFLSATDVDTQNSANAYASVVRYGCINITASGAYGLADTQTERIDDVNISTLGTLWGDKRIWTGFMTAAGDLAEFTPSAGTNLDCVDETSLDTSDHNDSSTIGHRDSFEFTDIATSQNIAAVNVTAYADTTDGGGAIQVGFRSGSTDYPNGSDLGLSASVKGLQGSFGATDPSTSAAWTPAGLNGLKAEYKKTA
jgi:hypothetical protein